MADILVLMRHSLPLLALLGACGPAPTPAPGLDDADPDLRKEALYALGQAERQAALVALLGMARADPDSGVRQLAIGVAGMTGDNSAIPIFLEILHDWEDTGPQLAAATALGNLRTPEACDAMLEALMGWPQPARDMVVNELRDAVARSRRPCEASVRTRLKRHPHENPELREILDLMRDR